jgi:hypothetical protein
MVPIIAWDLDGTINVDGEDIYPVCGTVRKYAKEVINLLHEIGVKVVIWTSRDVAYVQEECRIYDDLTPAIEFLDGNDIHYDAINKSIQFSPWHVNSRKVYAHMYVDDRAFGWEECDDIMLEVMAKFLIDIVGADAIIVDTSVDQLRDGYNVERRILDELKYAVEHWKD